MIAYKNAISPSGVGFDIACGNKAVRLDMPSDELRAKIDLIMDEVWTTLSFGVGRKNAERVEHAIFDRDHVSWELAAKRPLRQKAENQLGTIGLRLRERSFAEQSRAQSGANNGQKEEAESINHRSKLCRSWPFYIRGPVRTMSPE